MKNGFRKTRPREVVLSILKDRDEHLTAEEIYNIAKRIYPEIGFSSVYRTLKLFEEQGIAEAINIRGMKRYFQLKKQACPSARIHLICTDCNEIMDLPDGNETFDRCIEKFKEVLREKYAFDTSVFDVRIFGRYNQKRKEMRDMPGGDGTGPLGQGPMTGRGLGYCAGYAAPGFMAGGRIGLGFRRGFGWGYPHCYYGRPWYGRGWWYRGYYPYYGYPYNYNYGAGTATEDEITALKDTLNQISSTLNGISQRISDLEQNKQGGA